MRIRRGIAALTVLLILAASATAFAVSEPESIAISASTTLIDLASSKILQLSAAVFPEDASQAVTWTSGNTGVATVSTTGLVTAKKVGTVTIYARPLNVNKIGSIVLTIRDSLAPESIKIRSKSIKMKPGEIYSIDAAVEPGTASALLQYKSNNTAVASVTSDGEIYAKKAGSAKISVVSAQNTGVFQTISVSVAKLPMPKKLVIVPADTRIYLGEPLQLKVVPSPANAASGVKWSTSNAKIAKVSFSGLVTPLRPGKVKITAVSTSKSSVKVARNYTVIDPYALESVHIEQGNLFLNVGDTQTLSYVLTPRSAVCTLVWSSSDSNAVTVDQTGFICANASGSAVIKVKSDNGKESKITVAVIDRKYAIIEPERNTPLSQLNGNLKKIDAIKACAFAEIELLTSNGQLSPGSAERRKGAIANAFKMYRFPWKTDRVQKYWSSSSPSKAFMPGVVYYGMPYIQSGAKWNVANRQYNADRAVNNGYFIKTGEIYSMNHAKKLNGTYVGNDCSSFVGMSIWGMNHTASFYTTSRMAASSSPFYRTIKGTMLPGDLLVKSNKHTVMFLYYTNSAKTHMMIIEQGGGTEPNTIASRHKEVNTYLKAGYIIRRPTKY